MKVMLLTTVIVILVLPLAGCRQGIRPSHVSVDLELETPFSVRKGGRLVIGSDMNQGSGFPAEAFQHLYLMPRKRAILPKRAMLIEDIAQLRGQVEIQAPRQALAFCRLLTSPTTWYLLGYEGSSLEVEILSNEEVDTVLCFGDEQKADFYRNPEPELPMSHGLPEARAWLRRMGLDEEAPWSALYPEALSWLRPMGIVNRQKLRELGIEVTQASEIPEGYEVCRTLLLGDYDTGKLRMVGVIEVVGPDGSYQRKQMREHDLPEEVGAIHLVFPFLL